jgi:hypothetical protein
LDILLDIGNWKLVIYTCGFVDSDKFVGSDRTLGSDYHFHKMKKILSQKKYLLIAKIIFSVLIFALPISFSNFNKNFINKASAADCEVTDAKFTPPGRQNEWYVQGKPVSLEANLKDCGGQTIEFSLTEADYTIGANDDLGEINGLPENVKITIPAGANKIRFNFLAGEEEGDRALILEIPNVILFASFYGTKNGTFESSTGITFTTEMIGTVHYYALDFAKITPHDGYLAYNCDGACEDNWTLTDMTFLDANEKPISQPISHGVVQPDAKGILSDETIIEINADHKDVQEAMKGELSCGIGIFPWSGNASIKGCVVGLIEIIKDVTAYMAVLGATVLDFFIGYSLSDVSYRSTFVTNGWAVTRDIANLFFIFILLYAAIKTIIEGAAKSGTKKLITNVIVVALLINFSLFMTRVIIDATNILARVFYNQIEVKGEPIVAVGGEEAGKKVSGTKPVSIALVNNFNPQNLSDKVRLNQSTQTGLYILLLVVIIFVNITMFSVFLGVGLFFLGRVIGLWIAMVFAPLAFISIALPKGAQTKMQELAWDPWLKELTNMAIMAPIFIFFLYLILRIGDISKIVTVSPDSSAIQNIMAVIIPFFIIIALLKRAKKITSELAGEVGKGLVGAVTAAAGGVMKAIPIAGAVGGAAMMAGKAGLGAVAKAPAALGKVGAALKEREARGGVLGAMAGLGRRAGIGEAAAGLGKGIKAAGISKAAGAVEKFVPTPKAIGKFMGETKVGRGLGGIMGAAGGLAGKGLAGFGAPGLEKLGGAAGILGAGFLKPGLALAGGDAKKAAELGIDKWGYRNKKERKADKEEKKLKDKKHNQKVAKEINERYSGMTDAGAEKKSGEKKKKYDTKAKEIKDKNRPEVEKKVEAGRGQFEKDFKTKKENEKKVELDRDFEIFKAVAPEYQVQKDAKINQKVEDRIKKEIGEKPPAYAKAEDIKKWEDDAKNIRADASFKTSIQGEVDEELKKDLAKAQKDTKINQKVEEKVKREAYGGKDPSDRYWDDHPKEKKKAEDDAKNIRADAGFRATAEKEVEKEENDKTNNEMNAKWAAEKTKRVENELDNKVKQKLGAEPKVYAGAGAATRMRSDFLTQAKQDLPHIAKELTELEQVEQKLEAVKVKQDKVNNLLDTVKQNAVSRGLAPTVDTLTAADIQNQIMEDADQAEITVAEAEQKIRVVIKTIPDTDPTKVNTITNLRRTVQQGKEKARILKDPFRELSNLKDVEKSSKKYIEEFGKGGETPFLIPEKG